MKDLIERLRLHTTWRDSHGELNNAPNEAAAALSSQAARIEELEALLRIEREHRSGPAF